MTGHSFGREDRILKEDEFVLAVRKGRLFTTPHLRVYARPNGLAHARLGVSVSGKLAAATRRNRMKRLVREAFRTDAEVRSRALDIVVVVKDASVLDVPAEIGEALAKAVAGHRLASGLLDERSVAGRPRGQV